MERMWKNIQLILTFFKAPFLVINSSCYSLMIFLFLLYINDLSDDVICNIAITDGTIFC